jgi:hypothetical protein
VDDVTALPGFIVEAWLEEVRIVRRSPVPLLACLLALLTAGALLRAEAVLT